MASELILNRDAQRLGAKSLLVGRKREQALLVHGYRGELLAAQVLLEHLVEVAKHQRAGGRHPASTSHPDVRSIDEGCPAELKFPCLKGFSQVVRGHLEGVFHGKARLRQVLRLRIAYGSKSVNDQNHADVFRKIPSQKGIGANVVHPAPWNDVRIEKMKVAGKRLQFGGGRDAHGSTRKLA